MDKAPAALKSIVREAEGTAQQAASGSRFNATALIRGMFHQGSNTPQPGSGVLPMDWLQTSFLPAAVRKVMAEGALQDSLLGYGDPLGTPALRAALSHRLQDLGVPASPAQVMTTVGATQALDIVSRTLLKAGDPVMVEEPGWSVEFARLDALGMRVLPVPRRAEGPDLEVMARYCELHAPKLFVSVSVLHNPTGYSLAPGRAHQVLQLAQRHGFYVVEDDTYSHIAPGHATRLTVLDGLSRSIYVGGFAKILAPAWRVGFLAAPPDLVEPLMDTKLLATLTTPSLLERALALCSGDAIGPDDLLLDPSDIGEASHAEPETPGGAPLQDYLDRVERHVIEEALEKSGGNRTAAARALGVTFRSLRYRLERLGIKE